MCIKDLDLVFYFVILNYSIYIIFKILDKLQDYWEDYCIISWSLQMCIFDIYIHVINMVFSQVKQGQVTILVIIYETYSLKIIYHICWFYIIYKQIFGKLQCVSSVKCNESSM